jgi:hypothetical protein
MLLEQARKLTEPKQTACKQSRRLGDGHVGGRSSSWCQLLRIIMLLASIVAG